MAQAGPGTSSGFSSPKLCLALQGEHGGAASSSAGGQGDWPGSVEALEPARCQPARGEPAHP